MVSYALQAWDIVLSSWTSTDELGLFGMTWSDVDILPLGLRGESGFPPEAITLVEKLMPQVKEPHLDMIELL
ncbi:hypothetical protein APHAL10511_005923 [Amanita phalloides]|nr:hypothetical protein APHAL10511_005923 [Amanita phalloides]